MHVGSNLSKLSWSELFQSGYRESNLATMATSHLLYPACSRLRNTTSALSACRVRHLATAVGSADCGKISPHGPDGALPTAFPRDARLGPGVVIQACNMKECGPRFLAKPTCSSLANKSLCCSTACSLGSGTTGQSSPCRAGDRPLLGATLLPETERRHLVRKTGYSAFAGARCACQAALVGRAISSVVMKRLIGR
jgi:hypothetical protein